MHIAKRMKNIEQSATYAILDKVKALKASGVNILDLGGGEPDFETPLHIKQAGINALEEGWTHYTSSRGMSDLLHFIAEKLSVDNNVVAHAEKEIIVTPSAKHAIFISLLSILDRDDEIIIPTPSWVSYKEMVKIAGAKFVELPLCPEKNFNISSTELNRVLTSKTKAILINTPNNPTGKSLSFNELKIIAKFASDNDLVIISDEIYEKVIYHPARHISIASLPDAAKRTLTINGFSKAYAMTGWRIGYVAGPEQLINELLKIQQHSVGCSGAFIQKAAIAALKGDQSPIELMRREYEARRNMIVDRLNAMGKISCINPDGTFYVFADIRNLTFDSNKFAELLLEHAGVAITPGAVFGETGEGFIRFSFATSKEILQEAMDRIEYFLNSDFFKALAEKKSADPVTGNLSLTGSYV